jgi:hypothetical protein
LGHVVELRNPARCRARFSIVAAHTVEMLEYASRYYVVGHGYHSNPRTEAALETQRRATMQQLAAALEKVTGLEFGTNVAAWTNWLTTNTLAKPTKTAR